MLPRLATYNTYMQSFQYKLLNNVLFLNEKLHIFGIKSSPLCSFCNLCHETPLHMFYECDSIKCLWSDLVHYFQNSLVLPVLTSQTAIFEFLYSTNKWRITNEIISITYMIREKHIFKHWNR